MRRASPFATTKLLRFFSDIYNMEIGTIVNNTFPSIGLAIKASQNGRMSLPVAPGQVIYSHFRHISGTPAPEGTQGVAISRLQILDALIEQLSRTRSQPVENLGLSAETDENRVNALIEQYQREIQTAQAAAIYAPAAPMTGMLFNITA